MLNLMFFVHVGSFFRKADKIVGWSNLSYISLYNCLWIPRNICHDGRRCSSWYSSDNTHLLDWTSNFALFLSLPRFIVFDSSQHWWLHWRCENLYYVRCMYFATADWYIHKTKAPQRSYWTGPDLTKCPENHVFKWYLTFNFIIGIIIVLI